MDLIIRTREIHKPAPIYGAGTRSVYPTYGNSTYLRENSTYAIHINVKGIASQYEFTSAYTPVYSSARDVRADLSHSLDSYSDKDIWHLIRENTIYLQTHIQDSYSPNEETFNSVDGSDYSMRQWVKLQTQVDCIYGAYTMVALNLGSEKHTLGFLDIQKNSKLPYIDDLLKKLNSDIRELETVLFGFHPSSAVKGGTSYPYAPNRNSF